jgi:hypothetical protein
MVANRRITPQIIGDGLHARNDLDGSKAEKKKNEEEKDTTRSQQCSSR